MSDSDSEITTLITDISTLAKDVNASLTIAKSVKSKTAEFESNLGRPLCLTEPLYAESFKHVDDSISHLKSKINAALEKGDLIDAVALQSLIIAKTYISNHADQKSVQAISDLADIYYQNKMYDQSSSHSFTILKHISVLEQSRELVEIKVKSYYMIAKQMIIQKKYEKANECLRMGNIAAKNHNISSDGLKGMYYKIKAELNDTQDLYLSAIESYQALLDKKLYSDEYDHVEILIKLHRLYRSSCEMEKSIAILEKADAVNNSAKPRNLLLFLRLKLMLINNLESNQTNRALEIAEQTLKEIKSLQLTKEEKKRELLIRSHYIQLLMKGSQFEKALTEQKILNHLIVQENGEESIKLTLNQIQQAQILKSMGKQNGSVSLFKKTLHNKRFREHLRHPIFEKKLKSLLETFDKQSQVKLIADYRDLKDYIRT